MENIDDRNDMDLDDSDDMDLDDARAQTLRARCPAPVLNAALPWDTLTEPEREAWRVMGAAALALCAPAQEWMALVRSVSRETKRQATDALRPYARHADGCPEAPCTCGLAAVLGPPAG